MKPLNALDAKTISNEELLEFEELKIKVIALEQENIRLRHQQEQQQQMKMSPSDTALIATLQFELTLKTNEQIQQRQDYEDLLVLLEDQDLKIKKLKNRLRELGDTVNDESTDDDDDDDIDLAGEKYLETADSGVDN